MMSCSQSAGTNTAAIRTARSAQTPYECSRHVQRVQGSIGELSTEKIVMLNVKACHAYPVAVPDFDL